MFFYLWIALFSLWFVHYFYLMIFREAFYPDKERVKKQALEIMQFYFIFRNYYQKRKQALTNIANKLGCWILDKNFGAVVVVRNLSVWVLNQILNSYLCLIYGK